MTGDCMLLAMEVGIQEGRSSRERVLYRSQDWVVVVHLSYWGKWDGDCVVCAGRFRDTAGNCSFDYVGYRVMLPLFGARASMPARWEYMPWVTREVLIRRVTLFLRRRLDSAWKGKFEGPGVGLVVAIALFSHAFLELEEIALDAVGWLVYVSSRTNLALCNASELDGGLYTSRISIVGVDYAPSDRVTTCVEGKARGAWVQSDMEFVRHIAWWRVVLSVTLLHCLHCSRVNRPSWILRLSS